jgi:hypothetical protein
LQKQIEKEETRNSKEENRDQYEICKAMAMKENYS